MIKLLSDETLKDKSLKIMTTKKAINCIPKMNCRTSILRSYKFIDNLFHGLNLKSLEIFSRS